MTAAMWDAAAGRFCDGPCADPKVKNHGGIDTNVFTSYLGLVPKGRVGGVWRQLAAHGMTGIGDYGAFAMLNALSAF
eukprot:gene10802-23241_t